MADIYIKDLVIIGKHLVSVLSKPDSRIIAADLYAQVKGKIGEIDESSFKFSLSKNFGSNILAGFIVRKGRYGGILMGDINVANESIAKLEAKALNAPPPSNDPVVRKPREPKPVLDATEDEGPADIEGVITEALDIRLSSSLRIFPPDKYNWSLQKLVSTGDNGEEMWQSIAYWSTLDQAVNGVAKKILDKKLRLSGTAVADLKVVASVIAQAKSSIIDEIKGSADKCRKVQ
jgi:hypothetical protein